MLYLSSRPLFLHDTSPLKNLNGIPRLCNGEWHGAALTARLGGKAQRVCRRPHQGHGLVLCFFEFGLRAIVIDNACACLNMKLAITNLCVAQLDTGVKVTGGRNIADGAGIYAAPFRLRLVNDLHGANFRCA